MTIQPDQEISVRHTVTVPLPPQRAFDLFTARMTEFWPRDKTIGTAPIAEVVLEPAAGGRWFERGTDGSECPWGRVAEWAPPGRLVLLWQINADWKHDPDLTTEVEVTFAADGERTRVDLHHRHLERFGDRAEMMRGIFASPGGWPAVLNAYVAAAG